MKSERGMPASRTQICITAFSVPRISFRCARSWVISCSNMRGESLSSMNSSASLRRSLTVFGSLVPFSSSDLTTCAYTLARDAKRRAASSGSGPVSTASSSSAASPSTSSLSSSASSLAAAASFGLIGSAITSGAFGSTKPTMMSISRPWPPFTGS